MYALFYCNLTKVCCFFFKGKLSSFLSYISTDIFHFLHFFFELSNNTYYKVIVFMLELKSKDYVLQH